MVALKVNRLTKIIIFLVSLSLASFGQPDRGALVSILAILFGFSGIFFLLKDMKRGKFYVAFVFALCVFSCQLSWLSTTQYHGLGILSVYVFMVILFALQFGLVFGTRLKGSFLLASLWTLLEWSRLFYFCGFPFSPVGLLLTFHPVPLQIASIFGVYGLSFIVIFSSYLIANFKIKSALTIFGALYLFGFFHLNYFEKLNVKEPFYDVALVQTGLTVEEKEWMKIPDQWSLIFSLLEECKKDRFDLIVLPEVVITKGDKNDHLKMGKKLAELYKSEVVIGLIDDVYNAAFHVSPGSENFERYEKRVLVPVGEYLPFSFLQAFLSGYGITSFFEKGKEAKVFSGKIPIAVSICFEEGFSNLISEGRKKGAELLVNLTNDGWFPDSRLHAEHCNLARVRSIENGAFVLRACNTGISAVISPFGEIVSAMKERDFEGKLNQGVQIAKINGYSYPTIFTRFGNKSIVSFCLLCVGSIFLIKRKSFSRVLCSI